MMCCPDNTPTGSGMGWVWVVGGLAVVAAARWVMLAVMRATAAVVAWPGWRAVGLVIAGTCALALAGIAVAAVRSRQQPAREPVDPVRRRRAAAPPELGSTVEVVSVERTDPQAVTDGERARLVASLSAVAMPARTDEPPPQA
jgi:hypothetical protein